MSDNYVVYEPTLNGNEFNENASSTVQNLDQVLTKIGVCGGNTV